jgi:epoxyqueuosine reductase QueG
MENLTVQVKSALQELGADIVGFGSLHELPPNVRENLPVGICIAMKFPKHVILGISEFPTPQYRDFYNELNTQLDEITTKYADFLQAQGYVAVAQTRARVGTGEGENTTILPHKTVATRAGIGWIGKCAMLVTEEYGSMIRLTSILTNAPLKTATPINHSKCGECTACKNACPANAVSGKQWNISIHRDQFFNAEKCRKTAQKRSHIGFGGGVTLCGKCIEVCPYTRRFMDC